MFARFLYRGMPLPMLLAVTATPAFAQFDRGKLSGTIKDEQGGDARRDRQRAQPADTAAGHDRH